MEKRNLKNMIIMAVAPFVYLLLLFIISGVFDGASDGFIDSAFASFVVLLLVISGLILIPVYLVYFVLWFYKTTIEMRRLGSKIPNFLLFFIPLVNLYWYWLYSQATEKVTKGKLTAILTFVLLFLIGIPIAPVLVQYYFNQVESKNKKVVSKKRLTKKA